MTQEQIQKLFQQFPEFSIQESLKKDWEFFKAQPLNSVAFAMFIFSIQGISTLYLKDYSLLISIIVSPPLTAGFFLLANQIS